LTRDHAIGSVVETTSLTDHFTRLLLEVPDVDRLNMPHGPDTAVGVYFGASMSAPSRTYTVRRDDRHDARLAIDVLMHGDGVGTAWVGQVSEGDTIVLAHANSWYLPPPTADWQLLVADVAGFPALARILDEAPPLPTTVVVEAVDEDLAYLPSQPDVHIVPVTGSPATQAAAHTRRHGLGYCWFAGEASDARAIRKHLRRELHWESQQFDVMGYWRHNSADWDRRFALVGADLRAVYTRALDSGKSAKDAMEEFDEALEQAGL
jgi:NADPH-dependent ferric siderophore reductase